MHPNVENFIGCDSSYRAASIVLYGAPYDSTTSYRPGARFGPAAIRHESYGLETYSPYQNADLTDFDVFDSGDLELCFGSSELALADIEARAEEILKDGKFPLLLGGEHLVTLGAVRAAVKKYPDLHIVHFDAHADLRDDYLGAKLSHACVLRRCHELVGDGRIHQFCIRSGDRAEFEFAAQHTEMHKFDFTGWRRKLFAAAGCHPHCDQGQHHRCRPERAGSHAGHHRRFHRHRLQGAARDPDRAGQGLAGLSGINTKLPFYR